MPARAAHVRAHFRAIAPQVLAEHTNSELSAGTLSAVTAASKLGGDVRCISPACSFAHACLLSLPHVQVTVLVAGHECDGAAKAAAAIPGVKTVLKADHAVRAHAELHPVFASLTAAVAHAGVCDRHC